MIAVLRITTLFSVTAARTVVTLCLIVSSLGCRLSNPNHPNHGMEQLPPVMESMPRELSKTSLPEYVIEPPDVLVVEGIHIVPRSPYKLKQLDTISVEAPYAVPTEPIQGLYTIEPSGLVQLGASYGAVKVVDLTVEEAQAAIEKRLQEIVRNPTAVVRLQSFRAASTVSGHFRVGPDGRIRIGGYGSVMATGLTVPEAKLAIEELLSAKLEAPLVSVAVASFESKGIYVIMQGGGIGDGVFKLPSSGNETVLDAIAAVNGLEQQSSKRIWVSRPNSSGTPAILPVDWFAITERGVATTNYQLLPGDRVFVAADPLVATDIGLAKFITPLERMAGFTLLGTGTASRLSGPVLRGGGNPNNNGF